jgi:hypothetical protein
MGKASRRRTASREFQGSTRAAKDPAAQPAPFVARPFAGLPGETDWVALREVVPAATATVRLAPGAVAADAPQAATVATVLPLAWSGLRRIDGEVMIGLQSGTTTGDASRDLAQVLQLTAAVEPGTPVPSTPLATVGTPRLQDLLDLDAPFEVSVHEGFDFWVADSQELDAEGKESLERANGSAIPTTKLGSTDSAYWCRIGERTHLRWVLPHDEDAATDALARLHARGASAIGDDTRLLGAFRACGLLVPVWELDPALDAAAYEDEVAALATRFAEALAVEAPLTPEERRARSGLLSRQITLR